jgi:VWFA-related protein
MRFRKYGQGFGRRIAALAFALSLLMQAAAQQPATPRDAQQQGDEDVVRITTNLIQVDAVVLDSHGRQVTDLSADDFELSEDGRAQAITNFSYIDTTPDAKPRARPDAHTAGTASSKRSTGSAAPPPPARFSPSATRRVFAFVVDDLGLTFEATAYVRTFLKDFVKEQMRPGDLVAVVRTSAGVGALQQFSADPRLVERAVERIRFQPGFRAPTGSFAVPDDKTRPAGKESGSKDNAKHDTKKNVSDDAKRRDENDDSKNRKDNSKENSEAVADRDALFTVGTLGALNYVLRGASELPGRKSVVLITEQARIFRMTSRDASVREYLQRMADLANRASATVYDLDAADLKPERLGSRLGIVTSIPSAPASAGATGNTGSSADAMNAPKQSFTNMGLAEAMLNDQALSGKNALYQTRTALRFLAKQTGGAQVFGVERVIEDQRGFYLIGYRPDEKTFDPQKAGQVFHNITVRVKRPGLRVRHRTGFYSSPDANMAASAPTTRAGRLMRALTSPLSSGSIGVSLTPLFGNDAQTGSFVRALIHVDARALKFTQEPDGSRKASVEVLAVTLGESGKPLDQADGIETVRVPASDFDKLQTNGLRYTLKVPVKSPGAYQLRVAVLDEASEQVGSANELIEVPDLSDGRLALSGLVISGKASAQQTAAPSQTSSATSQTPATNSNAQTSASSSNGQPAVASSSTEQVELEADPAVRRLRPGMELRYDFLIYNAQADPSDGRPRLQTQVRFFRDGQLAYEGKVAPFDTTQQEDLKRLVATGGIKLNRNAAPGEYVLQIVVTDLLAKENRRVATQWIDFELVR